MQYLLFLLLHPVSTLLFSHSAIFQQTFIQIGRNRNFIDKVYPFDEPYGTNGEGMLLLTGFVSG